MSTSIEFSSCDQHKNNLQPNQEPVILADLEFTTKFLITNNISSIKQTDHSKFKELEKELM